uniref:Uncharacterized protein n=1 Tax=Arundo donax TaxID=35708 RepID=A0A0A9FW06_ARUDO
MDRLWPKPCAWPASSVYTPSKRSTWPCR